ncbi:sulfane dehydrogenase subunit SoxC [Celeribacter baekdonensis]|uniref:Sulfane dehydrogenase subunit SoxC n=1 Tax=Celeribacter baekdonensis TaxID=875171 RepID=A0A1G7SRE0_9RHOB|nr:sulfite dehydrogenase [Celeribacter baekdonensis]SDF84731.1 sulfane dehydrogenase subunit SoxC [Celeribacter baekdonensis]SDG08291.1 sulfane dehydrogenase subunit SoxC [Celeribacter baekdonensis]SDG25528.1 sulfane dehydrogenase subunit SoxC [Celeribacter baekdonensis]SDG41719.1 sulfane dehydrogenase subunit SoxC [Celeribacter baekdonensis]
MRPYANKLRLNRRSLLAGLTGAAVTAQTSAAQDGLMPWMQTLGDDDLPYGLPGPRVANVVRRPAADSPGFEIWHTPLEHLRGTITPNGLHFAVHHNGIPDIDPAEHRLVLHGMVARPLSFDLNSLARYPLVTRTAFIECAGNSATNAVSPWARDMTLGDVSGQISAAEWTGIPLRILFDEAGIDPAATWVIAEGADGGRHMRSLPLRPLVAEGMLALYQNGEPLRPSQGYPMRILMPGWEGNAQIKWLHRLELADRPAWSKDESGLYADPLANGKLRMMSLAMSVKSVITAPSGQQVIAPGPRQIEGLAWSGRGRIARVELSVDGGRTWTEARLQAPVQPKALTRFSLPWDWHNERAILMSRATDETGDMQPTRDIWHDIFAGHSFNHFNAIQAWSINRSGEVKNHYA